MAFRSKKTILWYDTTVSFYPQRYIHLWGRFGIDKVYHHHYETAIFVACNWWNVNTPQYPLHTTCHLTYSHNENGTNCDIQLREAVKTTWRIFSAKGAPRPPYPYSGKSFCQKTLSGNGGTPPPLTDNRWKFSSNNGSKRAKIGVFGQKKLFFSGFFLNGIGGYSPPP